MPYRFLAFSHEDALKFAYASLKLMIEKLETDDDAEEKIEFAKEQILVILQAMSHVHAGFANLMVPAVVAAIKKNHSTKSAADIAHAGSDIASSSADAAPDDSVPSSRRSTATKIEAPKLSKQVLIDIFLKAQIAETGVHTDVLRLSDSYNCFSQWWGQQGTGDKAPNSKELREAMEKNLHKKMNDGWHGYKIKSLSE